MRILVYPHDLGLGGSQLNAIEIAAAVRDLGQEVLIFAEPGPLEERVRALGLEYLEAPIARVRPSPGTVRTLRRVVNARRIDLLHAYEWPPAVNTWIAVSGTRTRALATVMSMSVAPFLPKTMPLVVGTCEIRAREQRFGRTDVTVLEPPVDLAHNDPLSFSDMAGLRRFFGLSSTSTVIVAVSRLAHELKMEGLLTAIEVIPRMGADIQLLIVGDGPARSAVEQAANATNDLLQRDAVVLTGELTDPRPAYAVADVTLGMGGSALRAMSFAKPVVVQGELGYWKTLDGTSVEHFLWQGWYGLGANPEVGASALRAELEPLLTDPLRRRRLGAYGRQLVEERFSLTGAAQRQLRRYEAVRAAPPTAAVLMAPEAARAVTHYVAHAAGRKWGRLHGQAGRDDFNRARADGSTARGARRPFPTSRPQSRGELMRHAAAIPLVDLQAQYAEVGPLIERDLRQLLADATYVGGSEVSSFEDEYANFVSAEHCIGVGNGTDALELSLRAVGVRAGHEVVLPANTFVATAEAVVRIGAVPVLVDVLPDTLLMDPTQASDAVTTRTRAVVPVHLYGQVAPVERIEQLLGGSRIPVVEDAAQAQGASRHGKAAGSLGRVAATSFYPGKNLGAAGDAGAVTTNVPEIAERVRLLANHGSLRKYEHEVVGWNSRLDAVQAVVLRHKLRRLAQWNEQRTVLANRYTERLLAVEGVTLPVVDPDGVPVWHLYVVQVQDRDRVLNALQRDGVGAGLHYPVPVHLTPAFRHLGYQLGDFPVAEQAAQHLLSLPLYPQLSLEQQDRVIDVLTRALADELVAS